MKNTYKMATVLCSLLISFGGLAQKRKDKIAPQVIEIDFFNLKDRKQFEYVKADTKYVMKIKNINQSIYKIEGTVVGTDYNTAMPAIFSGIKLPGYLNFALPESAAVANLIKDGKDEQINEHIASIQKSATRVKATVMLNNEYMNLFSSCDLTFLEIEAKLLSVTNTFLGKEVVAKEQVSELKMALDTLIADAINAGGELDKLVPPKLAIMKLYVLKNSTSIDSLKAIKTTKPEEIKKIAKEVVELTNINTANQTYSDSLKALVTRVQGFVAELEKFRDENKVQALITNYKMINEAHFTYYTDVLKAKKDELKFEVKISSDKLLPCNRQTKISLSDTYSTIGGFKVDFSTGVFLNSGNHDFMGRELEYKKVTDSTVTIQAKDGGKRALISVGALMHGYWRTGGSVNVGFGAGLSTTTAFDELNFHGGLSLLFGKEDRFVLTGGITMREAKILDKQYDYNTVYAKDELPEAPPTIKVFPQYGFFVGLTYNWSKLKSEK